MNSANYNAPLSSLAALERLQGTSHYCFLTKQFEALTGRAPGHAAGKVALARLHAQGLLTPLARGSGSWLIVPPEHRDRGAPPVTWWLHDYLSEKEEAYHLALLSAAQAHGYSHFAVLETQVFVPAVRRDLEIGPFRLRFFFKQHTAAAPVVTLSTEKSRMRVSSVATTLLDLLRHASVVGGIERVLLVTQDLAPKLSTEDIGDSLNAANDVAAAQRFGYLLDISGQNKSANRVERWLSTRRKQRVRLDVSTHSQGTNVSRRWGMLINSTLEQHAI
jgi:predicted transcriptional regulator of viral defense system